MASTLPERIEAVGLGDLFSYLRTLLTPRSRREDQQRAEDKDGQIEAAHFSARKSPSCAHVELLGFGPDALTWLRLSRSAVRFGGNWSEYASGGEHAFTLHANGARALPPHNPLNRRANTGKLPVMSGERPLVVASKLNSRSTAASAWTDRSCHIKRVKRVDSAARALR